MNEYHKISEGILGEETIEKTNTELFMSLVGQYFPEAIKDGEVDFTALKEEMGEFHEVGSEHYDFTWAGKQSAKKEAQSDIFGKTLKYKPQDSLNPDTTENIYIEGDNLEALKLLRRNYHGKIKMIYIDPPYNTGNDFVYHDNFAMTEEELANLSGDIENGVRLKKNPKDNARYHTNWLNMMYPRLKVARDLLTDDGVVFISIDDNEVENLRKTCDEIFGELNFVSSIVWQKKTGASDAINIATITENILVYAKNTQMLRLKQNENAHNSNRYKYKDEYYLERGAFYYDSLDRGTLGYHESLDYPVTAPDGTGVYPNGRSCKLNDGWRWKWSKEKLNWGIKNGFIEIRENKSKENGWGVYYKIYENVDNDGNIIKRSSPYKNIIQDVLNTHAATEAKEIFGRTDFFSNPKPVNLIKHFILLGTDNDDVILDFFSGSATTAHAVMQLNAEDGGNRKFIMVQLPEETDEKSEAYKAGYKNICEIGKERIRRAAKKIHQDNPDAKFDDGFKVFEVGKTTIRWNLLDDDELTEVEKASNDTEKLDFTDGHTDTDIVYEIMLRQYGIPLSTPIEKLTYVSDRTYIFADAVVVCLEPKIDEQLIERLASIEPVPGKFVLRDSAFNDDIELKDVSYRRLSALIANHQLEGERKNKRNNYTVEFI